MTDLVMQCTPLPEPFEDDEELLGYCAIHCETDIAMFHRSQVARVCFLANTVLDPHWPNWSSIGPSTMKPLIEKARARLKGVVT